MSGKDLVFGGFAPGWYLSKCGECGKQFTGDKRATRCQNCAMASAVQRLYRLTEAAAALYDAGHWTCDREVEEAQLWENLRDAMGRAPGSAPKQLDQAFDRAIQKER